jgi:hypothetical protein
MGGSASCHALLSVSIGSSANPAASSALKRVLAGVRRVEVLDVGALGFFESKIRWLMNSTG